MIGQRYEYRGLVAETWDVLRGDTADWPDRVFFRWVISRGGQPVLDVGCGTGRLLLDYRSRGIDIEGVDVSPDMLAICRRKASQMGIRVSLYRQAMEALELGKGYRAIIVPSSSFQLITEEGAARAALRRFYSHLVPGGVLAMSVMDLDKEPHPGAWVLDAEAALEDGAVVRHWTLSRYDPCAQLEHTEDRYELVRDGTVVDVEHHRRSPATRSYTVDQARALVEEAGFCDIRLMSSFTLRPATPEDRLFCLLASRGSELPTPWGKISHGRTTER